MKKFSFLLLFVIPLLASRCNTDDEALGTLRLRIIPKYGDKILVMQNKVINQQNLPIIFKFLSLYAQVENGNAILKDKNSKIALIDFTNLTDLGKASSGITTEFDMAIGSYTTFNFNVGVPKNENEKKPGDFDAGHPLAEEGNYWAAWDSFIFTKLEGSVDTSKTGIYDFQFSYHTGTEEMFRKVVLRSPFAIKAGETTELVVELDVKELLEGKNGTVNILKSPNAHSLNNKAVALTISNNYPNAIKIK
jgi:hypothetical protein